MEPFFSKFDHGKYCYDIDSSSVLQTLYDNAAILHVVEFRKETDSCDLLTEQVKIRVTNKLIRA